LLCGWDLEDAMPKHPLRFAAGLSLSLLLVACTDNGEPASTALPDDSPYAGGRQYPWTDRLDDLGADQYAGGRQYPWVGVSVGPTLAEQGVNPGGNLLGDLTWTSASSAWGPIEKNRSNGEQAPGDGRALSIGAQTFASGLGMHANAEVRYALSGQCSTFSAQVGVDDEVGDRGSVVFQLWNGAAKLYDSGVRRGTDGPLAVSVRISGVQELRLVVTDAGDNIYSDHADWGNARVSCAATPPTAPANLSDLAYSAATNGWGPIEKNRSNGEIASNDGRPLSLAGKTYSSGLGVHASSSLSYPLSGQCRRFTAEVGLDDEVDARSAAGSVVFQVFADGTKLFDSGVVRGNSPTQSVDIDVSGRSTLRLVVSDAGDGNVNDHADWAGARLNCGAVSVGPPPAASVDVPVSVPASLRAAPFDVPRTLRVPPGFSVSVYARINQARFLAALPNGDLLVSQPSSGKVLLVRPNAAGEGQVSDFASGLSSPHDLVLDTQGATTYLYLSESNRISRSVYRPGDTARQAPQVIVSNLPDASTPELGGAYAHALKNIAIDATHRLYVSVASATNSDPADVTGAFKRAAIYQYNADGSGGRLFAQGIRNAEGLAVLPGSSTLWVIVNNRDNIAYPFHNDWLGDGSGDDYGKVMQSYVNNHPPEELTSVRDGGNYGWPYCNPNPDAGLDNMPFDRDVQNNADGSKLDCGRADRIVKGIQAHSAPLGLSFLHGSKVPAAFQSGAVAALHGCWNCSKLVGNKVVYFPWSAAGLPGTEQDLVSGWVTDAANKVRWGRPVDAVPDAAGSILISDDYAGAVYKLTPRP
jgi:glucose/arabinose dehydrogenase